MVPVPPFLSSSSHENGKLLKITRLESGLLFLEINIEFLKDHLKSAMITTRTTPSLSQALNCLVAWLSVAPSYLSPPSEPGDTSGAAEKREKMLEDKRLRSSRQL